MLQSEAEGQVLFTCCMYGTHSKKVKVPQGRTTPTATGMRHGVRQCTVAKGKSDD